MRKLSVALALVALFTASTLTLHAQNYAVRGTIQEFGSTIGTRPLGGATVALSPGGRSAITDANGFYSIGTVPAGTYTIRVSAPGHQALDTRITVNADLTLNYVLQVAETVTYDLRGVVTESGSFGSRPLAGAVVKAMPSGRTSTSDANGRYAFENLPSGTYTLTATAAGHRTVKRSVPLRSDAEVAIDMPVSTTSGGSDSRGAVSGVIIDSDGHAISGASIRVTPGNYTATTDSQGRFTLPSIRNGTYVLHLKAPGYHAMNRKITIGSDRTISLTMNGAKGGDDDDDKVSKGGKKEKKEKGAAKGKGHGHGKAKGKKK
jgi:hypothetical protein